MLPFLRRLSCWAVLGSVGVHPDQSQRAIAEGLNRNPGFLAPPNMGMVAAQSERKQQPYEEQDNPSMAAQHMQQRQDGRPTRRGTRSGQIAKN
ncbi:hypothetical protein WJX77_005582 [Trebouxia sp. C0004]